jgi:hypothetical protein
MWGNIMLSTEQYKLSDTCPDNVVTYRDEFELNGYEQWLQDYQDADDAIRSLAIEQISENNGGRVYSSFEYELADSIDDIKPRIHSYTKEEVWERFLDGDTWMLKQGLIEERPLVDVLQSLENSVKALVDAFNKLQSIK